MLISYEQARAKIVKHVRVLPAEPVSTLSALNRTLAFDVVAQKTIPPHPTSSMDGFAFTHSQHTRFEVSATTWAGEQSKQSLEATQCVRIMTGGRLPPGADTVVKKEETRDFGSHIELNSTPSKGEFVRPQGEDTILGQRLLLAGHHLGISQLAALVGQNISQVDVIQKPRVAIVSTGDELKPFGDPGQHDDVIDINTPILNLLATQISNVTVFPIITDSPQKLRTAFQSMLDVDVLIVTGGASVGDKDFTKSILSELGVTWHFSGVAIKPGKPVAFGTRNATLVFALPGNPVSALVTFELFVRPAMLLMQKIKMQETTAAKLSHDIVPLKQLRHFMRARWQFGTVATLDSQSSGSVQSAIHATHLISVPPQNEVLKAGSSVELIEVPWNWP